jgi:hypothetical protein
VTFKRAVGDDPSPGSFGPEGEESRSAFVFRAGFLAALGMTVSREVFQQPATDSPAVGQCEWNRKPVVHKQRDQEERVLVSTCTRQPPVSDKPTYVQMDSKGYAVNRGSVPAAGAAPGRGECLQVGRAIISNRDEKVGMRCFAPNGLPLFTSHIPQSSASVSVFFPEMCVRGFRLAVTSPARGRSGSPRETICSPNTDARCGAGAGGATHPALL